MKRIVLTPVKNEEWILDQFLEICSMFADYIIIADQKSIDRSLSIIKKYKKVILINNNSESFNEDERQILLISKARELFGIGNLLLALDADEIITADSLFSADWAIFEKAELGTVFLFDKVTPLFDQPKALSYKPGFPLGYKDDGVEHIPSKIHSIRIPTPDYAKKIEIVNIKFLHLCFVRKNIQFSKNRYYCVLENINKTSSLYIRRLKYSYYLPKDYVIGDVQPIESVWYKYYDDIGVDLRNFEETKYSYMDFEVLKIFNRFGLKRFYNEPIWKFDWEGCRLEGLIRGVEGMPNEPIQSPNFFYTICVDMLFKMLSKIVLLKRKIFNKK